MNAQKRSLGAVDAALLTVGAIVGTGIFITSGDIAEQLPHPGLILLVYLASGLLILAGALTYAELGVLFPRAGGIYHYLKEAYGPLWGFLFGWTAFLVIMSGGIAAIATGFGQFLAVFVPGLPPAASAVAAIVLLTAVNHVGLRPGAGVQNLLTVLKIGAILALVGLSAARPAPQQPDLIAPLPPGFGLSAFGLAMIAALWSYDGWYGVTCAAGEIRNPKRDLPIGLIAGTLIVMLLYGLLNWMYVASLSMDQMAATDRVAETAAVAAFGPAAGRWVAAVVVVSAFGCLAATILYSSRIYPPMAADGVFFQRVARLHPRWQTPVWSLWMQSGWAIVLALSGTYQQLYTYVTFASVMFYAAAAGSVFVLRRKRPELPRPYRTWGYPVVPALFLLACVALLANTLLQSVREALVGLGLVLLGLPAYAYWKRKPA